MKEELTRYWLWMQAMDFACSQQLYKAPHKQDTNSNYEENVKERYRFVLDNWDEVTAQTRRTYAGEGAGYNRYQTGWSNQVTTNGVTATYRDMGLEVTVSWTEVKRFIEDMLHPDQQLSMFDLLLDGAMNTVDRSSEDTSFQKERGYEEVKPER
jgi:hypothetical protein